MSEESKAVRAEVHKREKETVNYSVLKYRASESSSDFKHVSSQMGNYHKPRPLGYYCW